MTSMRASITDSKTHYECAHICFGRHGIPGHRVNSDTYMHTPHTSHAESHQHSDVLQSPINELLCEHTKPEERSPRACLEFYKLWAIVWVTWHHSRHFLDKHIKGTTQLNNTHAHCSRVRTVEIVTATPWIGVCNTPWLDVTVSIATIKRKDRNQHLRLLYLFRANQLRSNGRNNVICMTGGDMWRTTVGTEDRHRSTYQTRQ